MRTTLDDFADRSRAVVIALAPIVHPNRTGDPTDPDAGREVVFGALVALMHYCHAAEVNFGRELDSARSLVAGDRRDDAAMGSEGGDA